MKCSSRVNIPDWNTSGNSNPVPAKGGSLQPHLTPADKRSEARPVCITRPDTDSLFGSIFCRKREFDIDNKGEDVMTTPSVETAQDELMEEWRQKALLQRIFLPGDFLDQVSAVGSERLVCHQTTMEYLLMNDRMEEKAIKSSEVGKYSTDLDYRPHEFKDETIRLMSSGMAVQCAGCSGSGDVPCQPQMRCGSCGGSGQDRRSCGRCDGDGIYRRPSGNFGPAIEERCRECSGTGEHVRRCNRCYGRGEVVCDKCNGSGRVTCSRCDGSGQMVRAEIITRKFSCSTERTYQLTGLAADEFKNGLAGKHFKSMTGDEIRQEFQTPGDPDTVLQRETVHSYDVVSQHYTYRDAPFCLNRIASAGDMKYVASGVPFSRIKTAVAGGVFLAAAAAVVALVILL